MRVFLLQFVRVGDPTAQLTDMYDTSPESRARGAVYRLLFISIAFIYGEYKAKCNLASRSCVIREIEIAVISLNFNAYKKFQPITIWTFLVYT